MQELLKLWPLFTSLIVGFGAVSVAKAKQNDVIKDVDKLKDECEDFKVAVSRIELEVDYLKSRDKDFIKALERNTDVCQELKIAIAVINEKNNK